jgi:GNAT superfamily N-acetyltransferase
MIAYRPADIRDRPGNPDRRFITDAWLKSYKGAHAAGLIDAYDWYAVMLPQLDKIFARPGVVTLVAHNPEQPVDAYAGLYGFICGEPESEPRFVYYVAVKEPYRRMGIARGLFEALGVDPRSRFDYACKTAVLTYPTNLSLKIPLARWNSVGARYDRDNRRSNDR